MAFYPCFFLVLFLASPLYAVKCYTGSNTTYNAYNGGLQVSDCNGDYCSTEILTLNYGNNSTRWSYMCGDQPGSSAQICTSTYSSHNSSYQGLGTVDKMCCKGDYCNSSTTISSLFVVIASFAALFSNRMV